MLSKKQRKILLASALALGVAGAGAAVYSQRKKLKKQVLGHAVAHKLGKQMRKSGIPLSIRERVSIGNAAAGSLMSKKQWDEERDRMIFEQRRKAREEEFRNLIHVDDDEGQEYFDAN